MGIYTKATNKESDVISYEITDHLGNVRAVVSKELGATVIKSYADYYPFGEQLPGRNAFSDYRYAFQGQELDSETGMEAFQLRLWDGRIGRWLSTDPYGQYSSPYLGMGNNPINGIDRDGGRFFPTSGEIRGLARGLWTGAKGLANSFYYFGNTVDSATNFVELTVASTGILGGSTYLSPYANAVIYDAQYTKTNTAGLYVGINNSINNYVGRLASENEEVTMEALGEGLFTAFGLKGLGSANKLSVLAEAGVGGDILALQSAQRQLLLVQGGAKAGITDAQLVQKAATFADSYVPFTKTGAITGTIKHQAAKRFLHIYQIRNGSRGFEFNKYFNNNATFGELGNRGFLDVINHQTKFIFDFKFGTADWRKGQFEKYQRNFEGYQIEKVRP